MAGIGVCVGRSGRAGDFYGDDDQIVPIRASAHLSSKLVKGATLKVYPGAPHGLPSTLKDQVNAELLAFIKERTASKSREAVPV
jgi:pimeloyl-ACP methyl ester carboxylesterase